MTKSHPNTYSTPRLCYAMMSIIYMFQKVRRCGQASQEAALLTQHKDVWVENLKRLQTGAWSLGRELELLLATLCRDIANSDSAKQSLGDLLHQINRSEEYQMNLR